MSAQDPALAPARIIEGIIPWRLNRGNFYVSGLTWEKFHARRPGFHLMSFGLTENAYMTIGTPIQNVSSRNSSAIPKNTQKFCLSAGFAVK